MSNFGELAAEYFKRVEAYIYEGNDIRSDLWMSFSERQEALRQLDRKRTIAHDALIKSFHAHFDDDTIENRTQLADKVASMVFEAINKTPASSVEGEVRDELAEMLHRGEITTDEIINILQSRVS